MGKKAVSVIFGVFLIFQAWDAFAYETLRFTSEISPLTRQRLLDFLEYDLSAHGHDQQDTSLQAATVDLNGDGISELIIKTPVCGENQKICLYKIMAENDHGLTELGSIRAAGLAADDARTGNVRNIIAYDNPDDDYHHSVYSWEAAASRYMMKKEEKPSGP